MKNIFTLLLTALSFSAFSQNNAIHVYPWNPDANHNNNIGADDLLPFLSVFGEEFGLPPEPCTYDGTDFEDWFANVIEQDIILDSLFFDFTLLDTNSYYVVGCPDPIIEVAEFHDYGMIYPYDENIGYYSSLEGDDSYGYNVSFKLAFDPTSAMYSMRLSVHAFYFFFPDGLFYTGINPRSFQNYSWLLPFPNSYEFDENGHIVAPWDNLNGLPQYLHGNELTLIPYWHYADE
jgi:hypothetical protein